MNTRRAIAFTLIEMFMAITFLRTLAECAARREAELGNE